jgi:hypothetical protein
VYNVVEDVCVARIFMSFPTRTLRECGHCSNERACSNNEQSNNPYTPYVHFLEKANAYKAIYSICRAFCPWERAYPGCVTMVPAAVLHSGRSREKHEPNPKLSHTPR